MKHCKTIDNLFNIIENDKKYIITIGNNLVSKKEFKTQKAAEEYINSKPYELIITTCILAINTIKTK